MFQKVCSKVLKKVIQVVVGGFRTFVGVVVHVDVGKQLAMSSAVDPESCDDASVE